MNRVVLALWLFATGGEPSTDPSDRFRVLSEKLALDLQDSRRCEVNPDNGYTQCHYAYRGLRFVRRTIRLPDGRPSTFVDIERLDPGPVTVTIHGTGPCMFVSVTAERPEDTASVGLNIQDGRIHADGRNLACFPKPRKPR